jgi:hypothetical protein
MDRQIFVKKDVLAYYAGVTGRTIDNYRADGYIKRHGKTPGCYSYELKPCLVALLGEELAEVKYQEYLQKNKQGV